MTDPTTSARVASDDQRMTPDPRLALIYSEALRALQVQLAHWESLHGRGGTLIFASSFATSVLGSQALADGIGPWDWVALGMLAGIGVLVVIILWPYYNIHFRFDVSELLAKYVDGPQPIGISTMHREMALQLKTYMDRNSRLIYRTRVSLQFAFILVVLEMFAWLSSIAGR